MLLIITINSRPEEILSETMEQMVTVSLPYTATSTCYVYVFVKTSATNTVTSESGSYTNNIQVNGTIVANNSMFGGVNYDWRDKSIVSSKFVKLEVGDTVTVTSSAPNSNWGKSDTVITLKAAVSN